MTLHQARLRHDGQVMRRSNIPRAARPERELEDEQIEQADLRAWRQRSHSTVKASLVQRIADVVAKLSGSATAPEYSARLPNGQATVDAVRIGLRAPPTVPRTGPACPADRAPGRSASRPRQAVCIAWKTAWPAPGRPPLPAMSARAAARTAEARRFREAHGLGTAGWNTGRP